MYLESIEPAAVPQRFDAEAALRRNLRLGMGLVLAIVGGLGALAATLPITGAIVAPGEVSVESTVKRIGHPTGGVVSELLVRDGDRVAAGQVMMRLDATVSAADAALGRESVDQLEARAARLIAERDALPAIVFPATLTARVSDPVVSALLSEERRVFSLRRSTRQEERAELAQRVEQSRYEIAGYQAQSQSLEDQSHFIGQELGAARRLWEKRDTTLQRLNELERAAVALKGQNAAMQTQSAQSRARIAEIRAQMISLDQDARSQAGTELSDVQTKLGELRQRKVAADDLDRRNLIRAPQAGVVAKLAYTTVGGVIPAGATIMEIVPDTDRLIVGAHIRPTDIDQVGRGQHALLRFSAFDTRTTPEIEGVVTTVSADRVSDEKSGASYYDARIEIPPAELRRLGSLTLRPGMPVEAFITTGQRTLLDYLVKPMRDQLKRAFREG